MTTPTKTRDRGKAIYRVRTVRSPIHQVFRGLRVEVATPNQAGRRPFTDIPCPSFDKPYFICYFGSYESWEYLQRKWPSIWRAIQRMGFTSLEQIQLTPDEEEQVQQTEDETGITLQTQPDNEVSPVVDQQEENKTAQNSSESSSSQPKK